MNTYIVTLAVEAESEDDARRWAKWAADFEPIMRRVLPLTVARLHAGRIAPSEEEQ